VRDVSGHHHVVDVFAHQRLHQRARARLMLGPLSEVEIGQVRELHDSAPQALPHGERAHGGVHRHDREEKGDLLHGCEA
jgi:hypothetical protein